MSAYWPLFTGGVLALAFSPALWRAGRGAGGGAWALAWLCLLAAGSGRGASVATGSVSYQVTLPVFGSLFSALVYAGARSFAARRVPRWLAPATCGLIVLRVGAHLTPSLEPASPIMGGAAGLASGFAGALTVAPLARRSGAVWDWTLVGALVFSGLASAGVTASIVMRSSIELFVWLGAGPLVGAAQLAALLERSERVVREGRSTLDALIEAVPMGIAISDRSLTLRAMNGAFASQLQCEPTELIGRSLEHVDERTRAVLRRSQAKGGEPNPEPILERALRMDDAEIVFTDGRIAAVSARPVRGPTSDGAPIGHLWLLRDVTDERRLQAELAQARQLETLARLAGGVAHDFNNKLTSVLGNAALLRDTLDPEDWRARALQDLEDAAQYCAALARDLLDFARPSQAATLPIAVAPALARIATELRRGLPPAVELVVDVASDTPAIAVDPIQLERVVTNLVLNARDACGEEGRIAVTAIPAPDAAHEIEIRVTDDGEGIDPETRERMFDPFYSTKPVGGGSGLGLAIVSGILGSHGGRIEVESELGVGTTFITRWPAAEASVRTAAEPCAPEQTAADEASEPSAARRRDCVMVVEDERAVRRVLRTILEREGYRIVEADRGEEAVQLATKLGPELDLAVVDLVMPGMSGEQTIDRLRSANPSLPAILLSGNFGIAQGIEPGVSRLAKPFRPREFADAVRRALDGAPTRR